eukprot:Hpha_TRINITY_DN16569_c0_g1::TRINITY_DN16569_c0_g1_i1::g.134467::m.134467
MDPISTGWDNVANVLQAVTGTYVVILFIALKLKTTQHKAHTRPPTSCPPSTDGGSNVLYSEDDYAYEEGEVGVVLEGVCPVCFDSLGEDAAVLAPCGHVFCGECCGAVGHSCCPVCRSKVVSRARHLRRPLHHPCGEYNPASPPISPPGVGLPPKSVVLAPCGHCVGVCCRGVANTTECPVCQRVVLAEVSKVFVETG